MLKTTSKQDVIIFLFELLVFLFLVLFLWNVKEIKEPFVHPMQTLYKCVLTNCNHFWYLGNNLPNEVNVSEAEYEPFMIESPIEADEEEKQEDENHRGKTKNKHKNKKRTSIPYDGTSYTKEQLNDFSFVLKNFYVVDERTKLRNEDLKLSEAITKDLSISYEGDSPKILIYHTHGSESFIDSEEGKMEDTIIGVGDELTKILTEEYHIPVYHDRQVYDVVDGKLDRSYAYHQAGIGVDEILKKYDSIEVIIDLHRDGVDDRTHLVTTINGKKTAKIMLFNGVSYSKENGRVEYLENPNLSDNLAFSLQMYIEGTKMYKDYMRKIFVRGYRYNLDKMPRALLIEAGAQTNTVEEEKNAMEPLAAILDKVLSQSE